MPMGTLAPTQQLRLAIALPLRNQEALEKLLGELYDPASPTCGRFLTAQEFADTFGPTEEDYATVAAFAAAQNLGITATYPNRMILDVRGSVADIQQAFGFTLRLYPHPTEDRVFYAPDVEPTLDLDVPVLCVGGLDNLRPAVPTQFSGSGFQCSLQGSDFRNAYVPGAGALSGAGQTVGILALGGFVTNDILNYEQWTHQTSVMAQAVLVDGYDGSPGASEDNQEASLDIEMVMAMAPGIGSVLVYEGTQFEDILNQMATDNRARQLCVCYLNYGSPSLPVYDQIWEQMDAQGQCLFNASGDWGDFNANLQPDCHGGYCTRPLYSTNIVVVGGTVLECVPRGAGWARRMASLMR